MWLDNDSSDTPNVFMLGLAVLVPSAGEDEGDDEQEDDCCILLVAGFVGQYGLCCVEAFRLRSKGELNSLRILSMRLSGAHMSRL